VSIIAARLLLVFVTKAAENVRHDTIIILGVGLLFPVFATTFIHDIVVTQLPHLKLSPFSGETLRIVRIVFVVTFGERILSVTLQSVIFELLVIEHE
jgi:hypothetical protein